MRYHNKTLAVTNSDDDTASECSFFSSTEDYLMVNQNTWDFVDVDTCIKTQGVCPCIVIGCVGIKDGVTQKALGHFGKKCKQVCEMAEETKTWGDVQLSYVGGWNDGAYDIVAQFETVFGVDEAAESCVMAHISPFDFPMGDVSGFSLGVDLDVAYDPDSETITFSAATWTIMSHAFPALNWDIQSVYEAYDRGDIGRAPVDLFLNARPTQDAFSEAMQSLTPEECDLVEMFYHLVVDAKVTSEFVSQYEWFVDGDLPKGKRQRI
jgi:hypothetical protein